MKKQLSHIWKSRTPTDRKIISAFSIILVVFIYTGFVLSAERYGLSLRASVTRLRVQAEDMETQALEYDHLQRMPAATASPTMLHTLVQAQIDHAGLSTALLRIDTVNSNQVVTVFGAIAFSDWLHWIAAMKSQNIRILACRIEAMSTPGLVNITATLARTQ